jgi:hypothetical protein
MQNKPRTDEIIVNRVPYSFGGIPGGSAGLGGAPRPERDYEQPMYDERESFRAAFGGAPRYAGRSGAAPQDGYGGYTSNQNYWDTYSAQFDTYAYEPPYSRYPRDQGMEPYTETFIGFHHSRRGMRLIVQGSTKVFLFILALLFLLLSRPGVFDIVGTLLRGLNNN